MCNSRMSGSVFLVVVFLAGAVAAVNIETVPVGNPGNAADTRYATPGYGSVGYTYNIGKYEVTAGQYTAFLNKVAGVDTYGLYNPSMWSSIEACGIERTGTSGSYTYSVASDYANRPVNYVSWGDSARFANWLHNGQPTGAQGLATTEDGAYYLNGATSKAAILAVNREPDWKWAITSEDEWYKAAYYNPTASNYYDYPTSSNNAPSNVLGNPTDPGNNATYYDYYDYDNGTGGYTIGSPYYRTEVGAHENSDSPYGTFDQGGNVWERNEAVVLYGSSRGVRGGSFTNNGMFMHRYHRDYYIDPTKEHSYVGFRVSELPEPATIVMLVLGGLAAVRRRRADH